MRDLSCPPRPPPPARPGQRTTRSPAPAAPGERVARAQNAPGFAENDLRSGTAFSLAPRARRRRALPVRLTQAFRDCPGQVLSRRMPGVVGPSPLTPHGPPFGPVQDVPVEGTTAGGPSVTDGRIVSAGRSAVRLSRGSSPFAETREPVCGNSPPAVAARVPGSRPPIAAEVGGLEPSAPQCGNQNII